MSQDRTPEQSDSQPRVRWPETTVHENVELVECVVCHRLVDSDEANCPDRGWMCEPCYDAKYGG